MSRPRKFAQGARLTLSEAIEEIASNRYIMAHGKPVHPGWAAGWNIRLLIQWCDTGAIRSAVVTPEWIEWRAKQDNKEKGIVW